MKISECKNNSSHPEVYAWCEVQHCIDILAEVVNPIGPHDECYLHDSNDQNGDTGPIRVHDVQHILASLCKVKAATANVSVHFFLAHLCDAGQAQEEANEDEGCSYNHFLASERVWELYYEG